MPSTKKKKSKPAENNQFLTAVLDSIRDGISVISPSMEILQANRATRRLYTQKKPLEGQKCYQAYHERTQICENCPIVRAFQSHKAETGKVPLRLKNGRSAVLELNAFPMLDDSGRVVSVVEYVRDVTRKKSIDEKAAEYAGEWQRTFDSINSVIWILDSENRITHSNKLAETVFNRPNDRIVGRHCWEIVHGTDAPIDGCPLYLSQKTGKRESAELQIGHAWYEVTVDPIFNKGKFNKAIHTITDISERKNAELLLKNSEQLYKSMFKNNQSVMLLIDPETARIIDANPSACAFYGYPRKIITKMRISDINTLSTEQITREMGKAKSEHRNYFNFRHRTAEGILKDVEVYSGPILVDSKRILCSIVHDISERKAFEKEREKLIHELQNAIKEIKTLGGLLPICASCKKIRDDKGYWRRIESYIQKHSQAKFSHGLCPECSDDLYGDKPWYIEMKKKK